MENLNNYTEVKEDNFKDNILKLIEELKTYLENLPNIKVLTYTESQDMKLLHNTYKNCLDIFNHINDLLSKAKLMEGLIDILISKLTTCTTLENSVKTQYLNYKSILKNRAEALSIAKEKYERDLRFYERAFNIYMR